MPNSKNCSRKSNPWTQSFPSFNSRTPPLRLLRTPQAERRLTAERFPLRKMRMPPCVSTSLVRGSKIYRKWALHNKPPLQRQLNLKLQKTMCTASRWAGLTSASWSTISRMETYFTSPSLVMWRRQISSSEKPSHRLSMTWRRGSRSQGTTNHNFTILFSDTN